MPNWCQNILTVNGPAQEIGEFKKLVGLEKTGEIVFDAIVPTPKELLEHNEGLPKWYWWRLKHWGCKWEPRQIKLVGDDAMRIQLNFETANTPPIPIVRALCEQLPNLDVELLYLELGNELAGYVSNIDGDIEEYEIYDSLEYLAFAQERFDLELDEEEELYC